jgi:hypothetical protein
MAKANYDHLIPKIQADFRTGSYSIRELAKKYNVSTGFIAKQTKELDQDLKNAVHGGVAYKQALASDNEHIVNAVNTVVDERVRHLMFFTNSALKNQQLANKLLKESASLLDLDAHSRVTARNKETVLGKSPETAIQVNNNQDQPKTIRILRAGTENVVS